VTDSFRNELKTGQNVARLRCTPTSPAHIEGAVTSEVAYFLIIVLGLPLLFLLLTGPGMWSEKWGWRVLDRLERSWNRLFRRKRGP